MLRWAMVFFVAQALPAAAEILDAQYTTATDAYGHGAVGGGEYAGITFFLDGAREIAAGTWQNVYEDTAPRLADLDRDGTPEVITVIADFDRGAAIRIWDEVAQADQAGTTTMAVIAQSAPIGTRFRWLAIAGAADLDGDGFIEIAYVDRPHLAKVLRILEVQPDETGWVLRPEAWAAGHTNHKYRDPVIEGGIATCDTSAPPEILTASADWRRVLGTRLVDGALITRDLGRYTGPASLAAQLDC